MSKEKVLLFGPNSWVATHFCQYLESVKDPWQLIPTNARQDQLEEVTKILDEIEPTIIISFVGRVRSAQCNTIDALESKEGQILAVRDNLIAPLVLSMECVKRKIYLVLLGTGCIFNSTPENPVPENMLPNFTGSTYSFIKGLTDQVISNLWSNEILLLRIRMPVSKDLDQRGILGKVLKYNKVHGIPNSMSCLDDLWPIMISLITRRITGPLNFVNKGYTDLITIRKKMCDILGFASSNNIFETKEEMIQSTLAERSNNVLSTKRLEDLGYILPHINTSIENILLQLRKVVVLSDGTINKN